MFLCWMMFCLNLKFGCWGCESLSWIFLIIVGCCGILWFWAWVLWMILFFCVLFMVLLIVVGFLVIICWICSFWFMFCFWFLKLLEKLYLSVKVLLLLLFILIWSGKLRSIMCWKMLCWLGVVLLNWIKWLIG